MPKLTKKEICDKWLINKTINPKTSRKIKENGAIYKELEKKCSLNPLNQKEICDKWLINKTINPKTSRKIKENGAVYKELEKKCLIKSVVNSETKKKEAVKKINKLFLPYVKRTSVNIIDRINYYIIIKKYLLSIKNKNNCFKLYNYDEKTNKSIYRIGKNIILDKEIGSEGINGIVFLSHFKSNIKYGTRFDKLNKFAVKITNQSKNNKNEIKILKELTKKVMEFKCPHFPINYGYLECNDNNDKISDEYSIVKDKQEIKKYFPKLINKNKKLLIQINELAAGDLNNYLKENKDILNTYVQIFLSILFFNICINAFHADIHLGNFLYHKIKPGGYFHYNIYGKDYYLENQGYLWVVWDFGLIEPFQNSKEINNNKFGNIYTEEPITYDYNNIFRMFDWAEEYLTKDFLNINNLLLKDVINKYKKEFNFSLYKQLSIEILEFLVKNVSSFTTIKPSNLINKTPYIIR
jgi:hypothetical protein